jgi:RNA 2',3'-cyclic 3'-phosphodiesterase
MAEHANERIRSFLAVCIAADVAARIVELKRELAATGADVRWARDDGLHATVKFLGSIAAAALEEMREALRRALAGFAPFDAKVAGIGGFPHLRRPRVLWIGLDAESLPRLAAAVEETAARFGFAPEGRAFRCHLTLGRVSSLAGWPRLEAVVRRRAGEEFGTSAIEELVAFRSDLRRGGAVYTKLWTIPFVANRTIGG